MTAVKRSLAFLLGLLLLLLLLSALCFPCPSALTQCAVSREAEGSIDVLILGDSESYSAISPMELWKETGYTAYVCGTPGQTLDRTRQLLEEAFQTQRPKLVILETNAIYRRVSLSQTLLDWLGRYFSVFQNHDNWKQLGASTPISPDDCKGYVLSGKVRSGSEAAYMDCDAPSAAIPALNRQYVREIAALCQAQGAEFLLLSTPSPVNWNGPKHNGVQALARELDCPYLDLNLPECGLEIDWKQDTRDRGDHLNYYGAVKVTSFLGQYLTGRGLFTDHRQETAYESWSRALERYEEQVSQLKGC